MSGQKPTLIPGVRAVEALLERAPHRLKRLLVAGPVKGPRARLIEQAREQGIRVDTVKPAELDRLVEVRHQNLIGEATPAGYVELDQLLARPDALVVALDEVTDPRNFGAILRSAEAMGATGALITRHRSARLGPAVTRTSAGASELLPVALETNLANALRAADRAGARIIGADMEGTDPQAIDWQGPVVLVMGAEGKGLRRTTRKLCHETATIPLTGATASLNVAVAAGILLYAASADRRQSRQ